MEEEPALGNWIKLEVEAEAERVRASLIRRVLSVRDHPMPNLTEASAYLALCFPLPPISPASHAGHCTFTLVRAHAPAHLGLLGPSWDPSDAMDCSEDGQCGVDGMGDPPSSPLIMLFTQHSEKAVQEPHNLCGAADDLSVTKVLIGDQVNPARTRHLFSPTGEVVVHGKTWTTGGVLVADDTLESPTCIREFNPPAVDRLSKGLDLADDDSLSDTPPSPLLPPHALPDEWLDVYVKLAAFSHLPNPENAGAHPSNLLGCGSFSECVEQSRVHAVKIDIDAIESTARSLLDDGMGVDQAMMAGHISAIRTQGMGQALKRLSGQMLPSTLHPRPHLISVPPDRHPPLPVQQHPTYVVTLCPLQRAALEEHCARIPPPPPREARLQMAVTTDTQCTLDPFTLDMSFEERLHGLAVEGGPLLVADDFEPNKGRGVRPYPLDIAPPGAIEIHMASNQRKGRVIVLPLAFAREACAAEDIPFHVSSLHGGTETGCSATDWSTHL